HEPERALFEIAQAAMNELGRGRGRSGGEVVLLDQQDLKPPTSCVTRDTNAVDAPTDDGEVEISHGGWGNHAPAPWRVGAARSRQLVPTRPMRFDRAGQRQPGRSLWWIFAVATWWSPAGPARSVPPSSRPCSRPAPSVTCPTSRRRKPRRFPIGLIRT